MSEIQKFDEYKSQITHILTTMFDYLSLEGTFTVEERGQKIGVKIASEDAGRIIGRKGQTLDSLQLILNRILFKQDEECPHVMLDIDGYANALSEFDKELEKLLPLLRDDDLLIITADHGCDPKTPSTDHSREYTPMLVYGNCIKPGVDLKTRASFADISATILQYLGVEQGETEGESFLSEVKK